MSAPLPPKEHLEQSLEYIRGQEAQMRRALQSPQGRLLVAIKHASQMLGELRTSVLPPKPYYELYNACFDALTLLQGYMREAHRTHHLTDIYEIVEYTGNVLPRLYLMITVGTAYLGSGDAPNQEVMKDMLEMSRGVQHPLRGMFLRYYLGQRTRDFLATASRADLQFSIQFTLTNFVEMNKLWVRYQHQGHSREFAKRLEERRQLQTVVGSNIYRLAQLDLLDLLAFRELVLPAVYEQVIQCRDPLAQEYLLDVVTQAFPAEYHLDTLDLFFDCVTGLVPQTSRRTVLIASLNRIYDYAQAAKIELEEKQKAAGEEGKANSLSGDALAANVLDGDAPAGDVKSDQDAEHKKDPVTASLIDTEKLEAGNVETSSQHDESGPHNAAKYQPETEPIVTDGSGIHDGEDAHAGTEAPGDSEEPATSETAADADALADAEAADGETDNANDPENETTAAEQSDDEATDAASVAKPAADGKAEYTSALATTEEPEKDVVDAVSTNVSGLNINQIETAPKRDLISDALEMFWHTIQQLDLSSQDRAVLVKKLVDLSQLAEESSVDLYDLLEYVVNVDLKASAEFEELMLTLFDSRHELSEILGFLKQYPQILSSQSRETRHAVAAKVLENMVAAGAAISNLEEAKQVFALFGLLLKSGDLDASKITQLLHLLRSPDGNVTLELLELAYRSLREGGLTVVKKTFGVLVNTTLLILHDDGVSAALVGKALKFVNKVCHDLTTFGESPLSSYRLYLLAAGAADYVGAEEAAYELFAEALSTYEEHITDSRQQVAALSIVIRALQRMTVFSEESFEPLAQRCQQFCLRLLKKPDQCRMLLLVATLYWGDFDSQLPKVAETLSKALRIADSVMDTKTSLDLFLDLLESYLYFLGADSERPCVKVGDVNSLLELIKQNFDAAKTDEVDTALVQLQARLERIQDFVRTSEGDFDEYQELVF